MSEMDLPLRCTFFPLGYAVEIVTNDAGVLEAAQESFGHREPLRGCAVPAIRVGAQPGNSLGTPPEPTRRQYNHLYSLVADGDHQALLDLRSCTSFVWVTEAAVRNRLYFRYNFLEKVVYLLLGASVVTDLHAACVSRNAHGVLLFGDSGAGKSTLAYACARAGWTYTSDDTSYLINNSAVPRVIGHAHRARFRPSARELFPELAVRPLTQRLEGKPSIEVPIAELPVRSTSAETAVHSIVYLRRHPEIRTQLIPLPPGSATVRACGELYSAGEIRAMHAGILRVLADVPTYELHFCDLNEGIEALETLTRRA
ncbi:MAG: aldolase [Acidobacteriaceae bacterium]